METLLEAEIKREAVHRVSRPMGEVVMRNKVLLLTEDVLPTAMAPEGPRDATDTGSKWMTTPRKLDMNIDTDKSTI